MNASRNSKPMPKTFSKSRLRLILRRMADFENGKRPRRPWEDSLAWSGLRKKIEDRIDDYFDEAFQLYWASLAPMIQQAQSKNLLTYDVERLRGDVKTLLREALLIPNKLLVLDDIGQHLSSLDLQPKDPVESVVTLLENRFLERADQHGLNYFQNLIRLMFAVPNLTLQLAQGNIYAAQSEFESQKRSMRDHIPNRKYDSLMFDRFQQECAGKKQAAAFDSILKEFPSLKPKNFDSFTRQYRNRYPHSRKK